MTITHARYDFNCACDGLLRAIQYACEVEWLPYWGDTDLVACKQARNVVRLARKMELYVSPCADCGEMPCALTCGCMQCRQAELREREKVTA